VSEKGEQGPCFGQGAHLITSLRGVYSQHRKRRQNAQENQGFCGETYRWGALFAEEPTWLLEGDGRSVTREIPATLRDLLTARLDHLGPAKEVAQVAAVVGREFSFESLQAVGSMGETELQSAVDKLVDAELIYARGIAPEATYQF
jgi:hypothetical protein